jgi:hypothetical protein
LVSTLGAAILAVSVFLPWYGLSLTGEGVTLAQQVGDQFVSQFGNAALQANFHGLHGTLQSIVGVQFGAVSAHDAIKGLSILLLVLAGLGMLDAMLPLVRGSGSVPQGAGGAVVLLGLLASACVVFRMLVPPLPEGHLIAMSVREGAWLALLGALMMALGGLWPRAIPAIGRGESGGADVFAALSGWTP